MNGTLALHTYACVLQFALSVRLMDLIFFERNLAPLFRFTLALLIEEQKSLLQLEGGELMMAVKDLPKNLADPDHFLLQKCALLRLRLPKGFHAQVDKLNASKPASQMG